MTRQLIAFIGKQLYRKQYDILKVSLLKEYSKTHSQWNNSCYKTLKRLLISGEDHRFKYHLGFDIIAIIRAIRNRLLYNKVEGASTIEQQLVRVLTNDYKRTFMRKLKEIFLSTTLSQIVPRKDIPIIYLYVAYYGTGMIGIEQVFKKMNISNNEDVSVELCAEIIARIKYPQPQQVSEIRKRQIEIRKQHLLALYTKHSSYKTIKIYE